LQCKRSSDVATPWLELLRLYHGILPLLFVALTE
jgi:hypothetical protein